MDATEFYVKEYNKLKGKTIKHAVMEPADADPRMVGLLFTDGTVAWVQCDEEGNGPGFLAIDLPLVKAPKLKKTTAASCT